MPACGGGASPVAVSLRIVAGLLTGVLVASALAVQLNPSNAVTPTTEHIARRTLRVSMYPHIPAAKAAYFDLERAFESTPIAWVDLLVIDAGVRNQKLSDAEYFLRVMAEPETFKLFLVPASESVPQYLLPARQDLYTDATVTKAAPLYPAFRLNRKPREVGKVLDGQLAWP